MTTAPPPCLRARSRRSTRWASGSAALDQAAPLRRMRIVDDTARLLRAPEVCFDASEIGLPAFAYNIENRHLLAALESRARDIPALTLIAAKADDVTDRRRRCLRFARPWRTGDRASRDRRRRPPLALPRGGRHRNRKPELSADRADLQSRACAAARRHLDRIPHRVRSVHAGAAARATLKPGLRGEPGRRPSPDGAGRCRARRRDRAAVSFASRQGGRSRPGAACFRSRSRSRAASAATASSSSARRRM